MYDAPAIGFGWVISIQMVRSFAPGLAVSDSGCTAGLAELRFTWPTP